MIPILAIIQVRHPRARFRVWLPVLLLWPLLVLLSPVLAASFLARRVDPFVGLAGLGGLLAAGSGLRLEVESPSTSVQVRVI